MPGQYVLQQDLPCGGADQGVTTTAADLKVIKAKVLPAQSREVDPVLVRIEILNAVMTMKGRKDEDIGTAAAHHQILSPVPLQQVLAIAALQGIVARPAKQAIMAGPAVQEIIPAAAKQTIPAIVTK